MNKASLHLLNNNQIIYNHTHHLYSPRENNHIYRHFKCCNTKRYKAEQGATSPRNFIISNIHLRCTTYMILLIYYENKTQNQQNQK